MASYEFDKGVPIPTEIVRPGVNMEMLKAMEVGESKHWPAAEAKKAARFYRVAKKLGIPILIRKVGKEDARGPGIRLWKVDPEAKAARQATQESDAIARSEATALAKASKPVKAPAVKKSAPKKAAGTKASGIEPAKPKRDRSKEASTVARKAKFNPKLPSTPAAKKAAEAAAS